MGSWVGPWVPFSKLSRQKAIETCEILIEQRDRQIRRAEAAEARLAEVEAERDELRPDARVICTNATWSGTMVGTSCHLCGHTSLVHPGNHNQALTACVICEIQHPGQADLRARLAEVEALCAAWDVACRSEFANAVRAAARGEGDRG